jgi:hypothetical protein
LSTWFWNRILKKAVQFSSLGSDYSPLLKANLNLLLTKMISANAAQIGSRKDTNIWKGYRQIDR